MEQNKLILEAMVKFLLDHEAYAYVIKAYFGFAHLTLRYDDIFIRYLFLYDNETKTVSYVKEFEKPMSEWNETSD